MKIIPSYFPKSSIQRSINIDDHLRGDTLQTKVVDGIISLSIFFLFSGCHLQFARTDTIFDLLKVCKVFWQI